MSKLNLLHFVATVLAGWVNRRQQAIIDYLMEESRIYKQQLQGVHSQNMKGEQGVKKHHDESATVPMLPPSCGTA